jgi:hypothetical protein
MKKQPRNKRKGIGSRLEEFTVKEVELRSILSIEVMTILVMWRELSPNYLFFVSACWKTSLLHPWSVLVLGVCVAAMISVFVFNLAESLTLWRKRPPNRRNGISGRLEEFTVKE